MFLNIKLGEAEELHLPLTTVHQRQLNQDINLTIPSKKQSPRKKKKIQAITSNRSTEMSSSKNTQSYRSNSNARNATLTSTTKQPRTLEKLVNNKFALNIIVLREFEEDRSSELAGKVREHQKTGDVRSHTQHNAQCGYSSQHTYDAAAGNVDRAVPIEPGGGPCIWSP